MQRSGSLVEAARVGYNMGLMEAKRGNYLQAVQEFDHAIATYERFEVRDLLAASLMAKATTQLRLAQPPEATVSIRRADRLASSLEDRDLVGKILYVKALALLANGRLQEAEQSIAELRSLGLDETAFSVQESMLRLYLARNAPAEAAALARRLPATNEPVTGAMVLVAVQAALRNKDPSTARDWLSRPRATDDLGILATGVSRDVARALAAQSEGQHESALQIAREAVASSGDGAPDERIQAGVLLAMLHLDQRQYDAAAAVLGNLDAYVETDYRVAWATWALYRALGDARMAAVAAKRLQALRGERDISVEPIL